MTDVVAVVIGRNEGERLEPSLSSVRAAGLPLVYADSGSIDGSPAAARKLDVPIVELDPKRPFSAARGRNEGLDEARRRWPDARIVMFLDGDCVLDPKFPAAAGAAFDDDPGCAIVVGHLAERHPEASIYNRLCAIEWNSAPGYIENFAALGGIMAARISALREVGGFNEQLIAGEDSELGVRLRLAKYRILKLDRRMAIHDAEISRFSQWWTRSVRAGHALAQRYSLNGASELRDCRRELFSTLAWGLVLPLAVLALLRPTHGFSLLLLGAYLLLGWRVYSFHRRAGIAGADARLAARFTIYAKFAHLVGGVRYVLNRARGRFRIIEYKSAQ